MQSEFDNCFDSIATMKCETMTKLLTKGSSGRQKLSKSVNNLYNCMQNDPHFAVSSKLQYFILEIKPFGLEF